jgi:hypothetical protein
MFCNLFISNFSVSQFCPPFDFDLFLSAEGHVEDLKTFGDNCLDIIHKRWQLESYQYSCCLFMTVGPEQLSKQCHYHHILLNCNSSKDWGFFLEKLRIWILSPKMNRKTNGTIRKCSSRPFQWMVMSVCFDNLRSFWVISVSRPWWWKSPSVLKEESPWLSWKLYWKPLVMSTPYWFM